MGKLFKNKYRITKTCLQKWNYTNEEKYLATIFTKNRKKELSLKGSLDFMTILFDR